MLCEEVEDDTLDQTATASDVFKYNRRFRTDAQTDSRRSVSAWFRSDALKCDRAFGCNAKASGSGRLELDHIGPTEVDSKGLRPYLAYD
jgi:hypothetical protein